MNDEYLKNAIIQFVVSRFKEDVMPREVARFIQSRFGELKISEARYEDLLSEADNYYPKYLEKLRELVYSSHMQENES